MRRSNLIAILGILLLAFLADCIIEVGYNHLIPIYDESFLYQNNIENNTWILATIGTMNPSRNCNISLYSERDDFLLKNMYNSSLPVEMQTSYYNEYGNRSLPRSECIDMKRAAAISIGFNAIYPNAMSRMLPEITSVSKQYYFEKSQPLTGKDTILATHIGNLLLSDIIGSPGIILFEESDFIYKSSDINKNTIYYNVSNADRTKIFIDAISDGIEDDSEFKKRHNIRNTKQGILYASHYPYYKKIIIITSLDDEDNKNAIVSISGTVIKDKSPNRKFIILNEINLTEGEHTISVESEGKKYTILLNYTNTPFRIIDFSAFSYNNGILSIMIRPKVLSNNSLTIESFQVMNSEFNLDCKQDNSNKTILKAGDSLTLINNCTTPAGTNIINRRISINGFVRYTENNTKLSRETPVDIQVYVGKGTEPFT